LTSSREELLRLSDRNAVAALRHFTLFTPGGRVEDHPGVVLAASSDPYPGPFHNAAVRTEPGVDPQVVIGHAQRFFSTVGRSFVLWVALHADADLARAAERAGLRSRGSGPGAAGMAVHAPFPDPRVPAGIEFQEVMREPETRSFGRVVAAAFAARREPQPPAATLAMFANPEVLLHPRVLAYLVCVDSEPMACAMAFMSDGGAGLYWVSTLAQARQRGLGDLITRVITNACFGRGAPAVVLQSSTMGESIYRRMGFVELTRYQRYIGTPTGTAGLG
jgi:hypothetical protein